MKATLKNCVSIEMNKSQRTHSYLKKSPYLAF